MEIEKITVKVEVGSLAVQAVEVLTAREGRTKEGAAVQSLLAGDRGFEPRLPEPESGVLPLD